MTEVTPYPVKTQGFHHFLILLFYDHLPIAELFLFMCRCCILNWYGIPIFQGGKIMKIAIASDHGGFALKASLMKHLDEEKIEYIDCGTYSEESCDYPDFAEKACKLVQQGEATYAILVCGTGIGMCIAANKMKGIRAALCGDTFSAHFTRAHNDANVMTLGARVVGPGLAEFIMDEFLKTPFEGGRHARRIAKIAAIEEVQ